MLDRIGFLLMPLLRKRCRIYLLIFFVQFLIISAGPARASTDEAWIEKSLMLDREWTGNFDGMVKREVVRVLVTFSKTNYFFDGFDRRGITYEALKAFEKYINKKLKRKRVKIKVIAIPVKRDQLIPSLVEGRGDIAAASLTVTPERKKVVDFADPIIEGLVEIAVSSPGTPHLSSLEDLSGKEIYVRRSSSYYESLSRLNKVFKKARKPQVVVKPVGEYLEDEDILEMVNVGLIPMTVVDNYLARFWSQIFKEITLYPRIALRTGGEIAWMVRKNSPKLKETINQFVKGHKKDTLFGNIMFKRYLQDTKWVRNCMSDEDLERFNSASRYFKEYGKRYNIDWLAIAAVGYQESRIDQSKRSPDGAVGVMQLLPTTAAADPINIPNIEEIGNNIHAGSKYLWWIYRNYFKNKDIDTLNKLIFTAASYNAGPARIEQLRQEASKIGLDPDTWFQNVEAVAAKRIGRETVQYVSNIYKYYVVYRLITDQLTEKQWKLKQFQEAESQKNFHEKQ